MKNTDRMRKKIVVVDDDQIVRKTFFMIFHSHYSVHLAKDAEEAFTRYAHLDIDLIITDLKLPRISGLEMIDTFRNKGYDGDVILISAYPDLVSKDELRRLSIKHFFIKPLDLKALEKTINVLFSSDKTLKLNGDLQPCLKR